MAKYKESEAYKADLADGNIEATKISFNCLYHRLASDHLSMDLSCYTLAELLEVPAFEDDVPFACPPTLDPSIIHSSKTFPTIHKDLPFEVTDEVGGDLHLFGEELNKVLTFDGGVLGKGEITAALVDP